MFLHDRQKSLRIIFIRFSHNVEEHVCGHPGVGKCLLVWLDKKKLNMLTNYFSQPRTVKHSTLSTGTNKLIILFSNTIGERLRVPNVIACYRATLGPVDRANAYRLRYRFQHRVFKHPCPIHGILGDCVS